MPNISLKWYSVESSRSASNITELKVHFRMTLYEVCTILFFLCVSSTGEAYEWSMSPCRYKFQNSPGVLLPGADGRNVSLSVDCGTTPGSAMLHWSNGGLPTVLLNVEYACFGLNDTSQINESEIDCLICAADSLHTSSASINISATLGTECSFFGCFDGSGGQWFTFSTQTCNWLPQTAAPTPSISHIIVQTTASGITATYSSATPDAITATPTPHTTVQPTDTAEPGGSATYSSDSPSSFPVLAWLVPVVLVTCVTAVIVVVIATCCYFLTRKKTARRADVYKEYNGTKLHFHDKPDLTYNPISMSFTSIKSLESYFDKLYEFRDSQSDSDKQTDEEDLANESPKDYCTHTDSSSYLNIQMPNSGDIETTSDFDPALQHIESESLGVTGFMEMDAKDKIKMSVGYVSESECTYTTNDSSNPNLWTNCTGYVQTLEDTNSQTSQNVEKHLS